MCFPSTLAPSLGPGGASSHHNHVMEQPETAHVREMICEGFTGSGPTPAPSRGTGHPGTRRLKPSQSPALTITPTEVCLHLTFPLRNSHQAEEKTPKPYLLHNSSAFTEASILCEQRVVSSHSPGVDFS